LLVRQTCCKLEAFARRLGRAPKSRAQFARDLSAFVVLRATGLHPRSTKLSQELEAGSQQLIFKDREDVASQLNRLGWLTLFLVYFRFQPRTTLAWLFTKLVGAQRQCYDSGPPGFWRGGGMRSFSLSPGSS
jgi:hypothetical protein